MLKSAIALLFLGLVVAISAVPAHAGVLFEFNNLTDLGNNDWSVDLTASAVGNDAPSKIFGGSFVVQLDENVGTFSNVIVPINIIPSDVNAFTTLPESFATDFVTDTSMLVTVLRVVPAPLGSPDDFAPEQADYDGKTLFTFRFKQTGAVLPTLASIKPDLNSPFEPVYFYNPGSQNDNEIEVAPATFQRVGEVPEPVSFCVFLVPCALLLRRSRTQVKPTAVV